MKWILQRMLSLQTVTEQVEVVQITVVCFARQNQSGNVDSRVLYLTSLDQLTALMEDVETYEINAQFRPTFLSTFTKGGLPTTSAGPITIVEEPLAAIQCRAFEALLATSDETLGDQEEQAGEAQMRTRRSPSS